MSFSSSQLNTKGRLRHFLTIDGLPRTILEEILDLATSFSDVGQKAVKKLPILRGKMIANLFFEPSTRTAMTFELAARRLSADIFNLQINNSSLTHKGESLLDTLHTLEAMHCDMFVVRHAQSGAAHFIAGQVAPHVSVINGGDGCHAHPTQAMIDMFAIRQNKPDFSQLVVTIVGDILHSRVARSDILALNALGVGSIRVVGPRTLIPVDIEAMGVSVFYDLDKALVDADVLIVLRLQKERMRCALLPSEAEYFRLYGLTEAHLSMAKPDAIVLHPGPINRGVEIASAVADGQHSVILRQVSHGIAVRMAVMSMIMGHSNGSTSSRSRHAH